MKSSIYFNEAEAMLEAFWDSGDTYSNHEKFDRMKNYNLRGDGKYKIMWCGVQIFTNGHFFMSRELDLDIANFDLLNLKMGIPDGMNVIVRAKIDGVLKTVIEGTQPTICSEFEGEIKGRKISYIELEFVKVGDIASYGILYWLTLANSDKRKEMLSRDNGYRFPDCWEGCFKDDFEIKPHLSAYFDDEELEKIRAKTESGMFAEVFHKWEKMAEEYLNYEPERYIGEFISSGIGFLNRTGDERSILRGSFMIPLAFVGLVKKNKEMLRMACRIALSASCCDKWTESVIGAFPGATFHHRAFLEGDLSSACAKVLDWAGEALTWHGRNIIYDAIIMKGFPRLESDIYTIDYIWYMNQGIVFTTDFIEALLAVSKRYPRYFPLIEKYESVLLEMWGNYAAGDGGSSEGPAYWDYSINYVMKGLCLIAKSKKVNISEYIPASIKETEYYAKAMLSTCGDGTTLATINDTPCDLRFALVVSAFFAELGEDKNYWSYILKKTIEETEKPGAVDELFIIANDIEEVEHPVLKEGYIHLKDTGVISLARKVSEMGGSSLFVQGGRPEMGGHEHEDKGSFIIEADGKSIIADRGSVWNSKDKGAYPTAKWHNLIYPEQNAESHQAICKEGCFGRILKSEYNEGLFECAIDVSSAWEGIFKKNIRRIISPNAKLFIFHDSVECDCDISFRLNTYGRLNGNVIDLDGVKLYIHTLNWTPYKTIDEVEGTDARMNPVNLIKLYGKPGELVTVLELSKGDSIATVENGVLKYKDIVVEYSNGKVNIR